jgi:hypothetical protein
MKLDRSPLRIPLTGPSQGSAGDRKIVTVNMKEISLEHLVHPDAMPHHDVLVLLEIHPPGLSTMWSSTGPMPSSQKYAAVAGDFHSSGMAAPGP